MPSRRETTALLMLACLPGVVRAATPRTVTDARGRKIAVGPARRLVSIGGTITETLYGLGASARIVAVDTTSTWPERALREKKSVGYMRMLSSEGVLSMAPDLILAMNDAGPAPALDQLQASRVPIVFVDATPSPAAILARTRFLADLVDARAAGNALCATIDAGFRALADWRAHHPGGRRVLFVMRVTGGRIMAAGRGTAADAVIALAGATNVAAALHGYQTLDQESLLALRPDVVVTMTEGGDAVRGALIADAGFRASPAGRAGAILAMEGERLLGFGPRTPDAALDLAHRLAK
jgi:iron complex transport system substrate-binding protein